MAEAIIPLASKPRFEILDGLRGVAVSIFIASIAVAYASVKVYDVPVRE